MSTAAPSEIVRCPRCGVNNRIDPSRKSEAVCGRCKALLSAPSSSPVIITDANFSTVVEASPLPVLVDFWAAWCGPCRVVAPVIEQLARELSGRVRVGKLDVDASPVTASRFHVQSIPSLLIFKGGKEVDRMVGVQSKEAILLRLQRFV